MAERSYCGLLWGLVLGGTALDQASKYGVFKWLYSPPGEAGECQIISGVFEFYARFTKQTESADSFLGFLRTGSGELLPQVNQGALFGLGNDYGGVANAIFAVVSVIAALAIAYWSMRRSTARDGILCAALGLILAGTLGNLYDRLVFNGVRDFLHFYWFEFPVFNIADSCLVCGAGLLFLHACWNRPATAPQTDAEGAFSSATVEAG